MKSTKFYNNNLMLYPNEKKPVEHDQHKDTNRNKETALVCEVDVLGEKEKESGVQETKEKGNDEEEEEENDWEEEEDKDVEIDEDDDVPLSEPEIRFFLECFPGRYFFKGIYFLSYKIIFHNYWLHYLP